MTWLSKLRAVFGERTNFGRWYVAHPGHGEKCQPAYIRTAGEYGDYEISVDHRRDYSDPLPDARFIATTANLSDAMLDVCEAAEKVRNKFSTMSWCRLSHDHGETTCVPTVQWKELLYDFHQPLDDALAVLRELAEKEIG